MKKVRIVLREGTMAPVYFKMAGRATGKSVNLFHGLPEDRDWQAFHVKGFAHPLVRIYSTSGMELLFCMQVQHLPAQDKLSAFIESIHESSVWNLVHDHEAGMQIPLVVHCQFVMVAEDNPAVQLPDKALSVDPPWLIWIEDNDPDHRPLLISTLNV